MFESVGLQEKFEKEVESKALRTARPWRARLFGTTYRKVRLTLPDVERRLRAELEEEARSRVSADGGRLAPLLRMERSSSTSCVGQCRHVATWCSSAILLRRGRRRTVC